MIRSSGQRLHCVRFLCLCALCLGASCAREAWLSSVMSRCVGVGFLACARHAQHFALQNGSIGPKLLNSPAARPHKKGLFIAKGVANWTVAVYHPGHLVSVSLVTQCDMCRTTVCWLVLASLKGVCHTTDCRVACLRRRRHNTRYREYGSSYGSGSARGRSNSFFGHGFRKYGCGEALCHEAPRTRHASHDASRSDATERRHGRITCTT